MTIADVFEKENLENSVLIGYYGGGNFGDELLLEILMNLFARQKVQALTVTYQHPERYATYHHEFGYTRIDMADKKAVLRAIMHNKNIVIGGGGLWGLDVNPNIFLLSSLLFVSRFLLRKRVYLLGVGYYHSTSRLGHVSAWLAAKSARTIVCRDDESLNNFKKINRRVSLDVDIAYTLPRLELDAYREDFETLDKMIHIDQKTLFITLRRFKASLTNNYTATIERCLEANPGMPVIVALMEPREVDPEGYEQLVGWQKQHENIRIVDFSYNPIGLYLFFKTYKELLVLVAPQFHAIIAADLAGVPYYPVAYDNKVLELLKTITDERAVPIADMTEQSLQSYIDTYFRQVIA